MAPCGRVDVPDCHWSLQSARDSGQKRGEVANLAIVDDEEFRICVQDAIAVQVDLLGLFGVVSGHHVSSHHGEQSRTKRQPFSWLFIIAVSMAFVVMGMTQSLRHRCY